MDDSIWAQIVVGQPDGGKTHGTEIWEVGLDLPAFDEARQGCFYSNL